MTTPQHEFGRLPIPGWRPMSPVRIMRLEDLSPTIRNFARLLGGPSNRHIRDMVESTGPASEIDYDRDALEFNRTFFLRNAIKCVTASRMFLDGSNRFREGAVLDVGGGVGTFALAASERRSFSDRLVVDRSCAQVSLGRRLLNAAGEDYDMRWTVSDELPRSWSRDSLALFSFSLCESPQLLSSALLRGWHGALVVDFPEVIDRCAIFASQIGARFVCKRMSVELCADLARSVGQPNVSLAGGLLVCD